MEHMDLRVFVLSVLFTTGGIGEKPAVWHVDTQKPAYDCVVMGLEIVAQSPAQIQAMCSLKKDHPAFNWPTSFLYRPVPRFRPMPWRY